MASEVFNLAIFLSLKDGASGGIDRFEAKMSSAAQKVNKDLQSIERSAKQQAKAVSDAIGKKTSEIEKFGGKLSNLDKLKNAGLENTIKQSATIYKQIKQEASAVEDLGREYKQNGKSDAASQAANFSSTLRSEARGIEQIGDKLKNIQKLRQKGTDDAKHQAQILESEVKDEIKNLDRLSSKLREIKSLKTDNLEIKVKADDLRRQVAGIEALNEHYDELRQNLNRDLTIGGVGLGGLAILNSGIKSAANYEDALFELRKAFQENEQASGRSFAEQEKDFTKLVALATDLGGSLQGSTADYANLLTSLNKAGIDATATLNGTGKAVAYLANVTGAIRKGTAGELAEDFGSFAKMFSVKGEKELMQMVNMFAAIDDRFNLQSSNLIEGAKYFALTANDSMQLKGFEGASETMKLMAFMKRFTAREGSVAGTSLDNLVSQYLSHADKLKALQKQHGISIDFFDNKGNFKGANPEERVKTLFTELEKLQKLNPKERATWIKDIFGEVGFEAATAISSQGLKGYQEINSEMAKAVDVTKQINQQMDTYNAKYEALSGSLESFKATAFTPLMQDAKTFVDYGSSIANTLQKVAAENPELMNTLGTLAAYGSTALIAYSGIKSLTTGVRLLSMVSKFSRGEGLLPYLQGVTTEAGSASGTLGGAAKQANGLKGALGQLAGSSAFKIGVQVIGIAAAEYTLTHLIQMWSEAAEKSRQFYENAKNVAAAYDELAGLNLLHNAPGNLGGRQDVFDRQANNILDIMKNGQDLQSAFNPEKRTWHEYFTNPSPYGMMPNQSQFSGVQFSPEVAEKMWRQGGLGRDLHDPNVIARLIVAAGKDKDLNLNKEKLDLLVSAIERIAEKDVTDTAKNLAYGELFGQKQNDQPARNINDAFKPPTFAPNNFKLPFFLENKQFGGFKQTTGIDFNNSKPLPQINSLSQIATNLNTFVGSTGKVVTTFNEINTPSRQVLESMLALPKPIDDSKTSLGEFWKAVDQTKTPLNSVITSANGVSQALNSLSEKFISWQPPTPQVQTITLGVNSETGETKVVGIQSNKVDIPSRAIGGIVEQDGIAQVHAGNIITPARVSKGLNISNLNSAKTSESFSINYSPNVTINGADKNAKAKFQAMLSEHRRQIEQIISKRMQNGRARS